MVQSPLAQCLAKLSNGQDSHLLAIGDSTCEGLYDSPVIFSTASAGYGWFGQLGARIGATFDVNVKYIFMDVVTSPSFYSPTGWDTTEYVVWTSTQGSSAPTLTMHNGGSGGNYLGYIESTYASLDLFLTSPPVTLDLIIICDGFNDITARGVYGATFVSQYQTLIGNIQAAQPGVPILATTQNQELEGDANIPTTFSLLATTLTGLSSWPLATPLAATTISGVYLLDTWQAFDGQTLSAILAAASGPVALHPNHAGYVIYGDWMYDQLVGNANAGKASGGYGFSANAAGSTAYRGTAAGSYGWTAHPSAWPITTTSKLPWSAPFELIIGGVGGATYGWTSAPYGTRQSLGTAAGTLSWSGAQNPGGTLPWTPPTTLGSRTGTTGTKHTSGAASGVFAWRSFPPTAGANNLTGSALPWTAPVTLGTPPPDYSRTTGLFGWTAAATGKRTPKAASTATYGWTAAAYSVTPHLGTTAATYGWTAAAQGYWTGRTTGTYGWIAQAAGARASSGATSGNYGWATVQPQPGVMVLSDIAVAVMTLADIPAAAMTLADTATATMVLEISA